MKQLTYVQKNVLEWQEVPTPIIEDDQDAIVRPIAVARCDLDSAIIAGSTPFSGPFALGHEFVAEVVEVGDKVQHAKPGDRVVVLFQISCGSCDFCQRGLTSACTQVKPFGSMYGIGAAGGDWGGALSDLVRVPFANHMLIPLPDGLSPAFAASASDNINDAYRTVAPHLKQNPHANVLVVGGWAPSISLYAVVVALALGADGVDYIDPDPDRQNAARALGARVLDRPEGAYRITVDASGDPAGLRSTLRATEPYGICTSIGIYFRPVEMSMLHIYSKGITFITGRVNAGVDLPDLLPLMAQHRSRFEQVPTRTIQWDEAHERLSEPMTKMIVLRD